MGQFEGDDHRETKDIVFVEIVGCLIEEGMGEKAKRKGIGQTSISASCFTCQVIHSTSKIDSEYFRCHLDAFL